ncbi:hypothetical protein IPM62_05495 [Candidatus Woesebacteria bacterium]|nr:MAG: hypothetical protein IPM62_05495 [Candidatus Woesebacteria bacterium]
MARARKYTTFNRARLMLFTHSYACYAITCHVKTKYKINDNLTPRELRKRYINKRIIPEISRLSYSLHFDYEVLWRAILLNKKPLLSKQVRSSDGIRLYLAIEDELIALAESKRHRSRDFFDPDYENEYALLSIAIERAAGSLLNDVEDDFVFDQQCEEMKKICFKWYYKIAYRYKLPTTRIVPFVLRLIS